MLPISLIPIEIETERLIIQPFQDDDFENSVLLYSDARITKYFDFVSAKHFTGGININI